MTATASRHRMTTAKAMVDGIAGEMERDESVIVLGEDVGAYGGIFSSSTGLLDRFGATRVIDTPISETAFIGLGIGAAVEGLRPIVELMFVDFFGVCMDQIYNHMAKISYESGGNVQRSHGADDGGRWRLQRRRAALAVPVGHLRAPARHEGRGAQQPVRRQGSDDFRDPRRQPGRLHVPQGSDGARLDGEEPALGRRGPRRAVRGADRQGPGRSHGLGRHRGDGVAVGAPRARRRRTGSPARASTSRCSTCAASCRWTARRFSPPWRKTGRLVVVDEDYLSYGLSGEVVATVTDVDPSLLRARVARVAVPDVPIPYAHALEYAVLPRPERIEAAIRAVVGA